MVTELQKKKKGFLQLEENLNRFGHWWNIFGSGKDAKF